MGFEHLCDGIALVGCKVVEDDDGAGFLLGDKDLFDVRVEGVPAHGAGDQPRGHDPTTRQTRDQGLVAPPPERRCALEALVAQAASVRACHFGIGARLIRKDQPMRLLAHDFLAPRPVMSRLSHLGLASLFGEQAFFL